MKMIAAAPNDYSPISGTEQLTDDDVIRLHRWGIDEIYPLPRPPCDGLLVGTSRACALRLKDGSVADKHAELVYERQHWRIRRLVAGTSVRQDGAERDEFMLAPGVEVGIGNITFVAESARSIALREFCARLLGWGADRMRAVDHALRAIRIACTHRSALVLRGEGDLVPIAHALHRRALGLDAPFIVCDRRRQDTPASVRSPANVKDVEAAFDIAIGGTLCVRSSRMPGSLPARFAEPGYAVQLIVCADRLSHGALGIGPTPVELPPLRVREAELPRIVQAYADEAIITLGGPADCFTAEDHSWVMERAARSLSEIEKATMRVVAVKLSSDLRRAADRLGMRAISLSRWLERRVQTPDRRRPPAA